MRDLAAVRGTLPATLAPDEALITERLAATDGVDVGDRLTILGHRGAARRDHRRRARG